MDSHMLIVAVIICSALSIHADNLDIRLNLQVGEASCGSSCGDSSSFAKYLVLPVNSFGIESNSSENITDQKKPEPPAKICQAFSMGSTKDCGYLWVENVNNERIPRVIKTAVCSCETKSKPGYLCSEIKYALPVLYKNKNEYSVTTYEQGWEYVTVACVDSPKSQPKSAYAVLNGNTKIPHERLIAKPN